MPTVPVHHWTGLDRARAPMPVEMGAVELEAEIHHWRRIAEGLEAVYRTWQRHLATEFASAYRSLMLEAEAFAQQQAVAVRAARGAGSHGDQPSSPKRSKRAKQSVDSLGVAWQARVRSLGFTDRINRALDACCHGYLTDAGRWLQPLAGSPPGAPVQTTRWPRTVVDPVVSPDRVDRDVASDLSTGAGYSTTGEAMGPTRNEDGSAADSLSLVGRVLGVAAALLPATLGIAGGPVGWALVGLEQACQGLSRLGQRVDESRQGSAAQIRQAVLRGLQRQEERWQQQASLSLRSLHYQVLSALGQQLQARWEQMASENPSLAWLWEQPSVQARWTAYAARQQALSRLTEQSQALSLRLVVQLRADLIDQAARMGWCSGDSWTPSARRWLGDWTEQQVRRTAERYAQELRRCGLAALGDVHPGEAVRTGLRPKAPAGRREFAPVGAPEFESMAAGARGLAVAVAPMRSGDRSVCGHKWQWLVQTAGLCLPPLAVATQLSDLHRELRRLKQRRLTLRAATEWVAEWVARVENQTADRLDQLQAAYLAQVRAAFDSGAVGEGGPAAATAATAPTAATASLSAMPAGPDRVQWQRATALLDALALVAVVTQPAYRVPWRTAV